MKSQSTIQARLISQRWLVSSFAHCHQPSFKEGEEEAKRVTRELVSPLHFSRRPGQENKPSPRGPAECHSQCVPASTIPDILASHPFQSKERNGERCWLPHCRALSILISRVWLRSWIDENKEGEGNDEKKEGKFGRRWTEWRGNGRIRGKILKRWLFVIRSVLRRKSRVNFDPFFSSENNNLRWTNGRGNLSPFCARGNIYELRKGKAYSSLEGRDSLRFSHSLCK